MMIFGQHVLHKPAWHLQPAVPAAKMTRLPDVKAKTIPRRLIQIFAVPPIRVDPQPEPIPILREMWNIPAGR